MRICLLTDQDLDGEIEEGDWPCDPRPHLPEATWGLAVLEKSTLVQQLIEESQKDFDLFFNLCDGAWDEGRPGIEVVDALERLGQAFTGADTRFFEPSREAMKRACRARGIRTPDYVIARTVEDVERATDTLRFPMIVKHPSSYASAGLTRQSRVESVEDLYEQARLMIAQYAGALIEEFVEGIECTVLVADNPDDWSSPVTYRPIQYRFPEGESFKHYDLKWEDYGGLEATPVTHPDLDRTLRRASADFFVAINGTGYGRCDFRVDRDGNPFVLEINPNCGVYYPVSDPGSADLCLLHDPAGHRGFTEQVVAAALGRHRARQRGWSVRAKDARRYGVFATRPARAGERIIALEGEAHEIVTRSHVESTWQEPQLTWFRSQAWPLTDEVWVVWSRDPESWRPVGHSCDPSCWLAGLDVVARRDLEAGEEITIDYATARNELMPDFACSCGSAVCRGVVRGSDYLEDFVDRYGDYVSDYVRSRRQRQFRRAVAQDGHRRLTERGHGDGTGT